MATNRITQNATALTGAILVSVLSLFNASCTVVGTRSLSWGGLHVVSHGAPLGIGASRIDPFTSLTLKVDDGGPEILARLPDGTFVSPKSFKLKHALRWLKDDSNIQRPGTMASSTVKDVSYYKDDQRTGGVTQYGKGTSITVGLVYSDGRSTLSFNKSSGRLTRWDMIRSSVYKRRPDASRMAIRAAGSEEVLAFPIYYKDLKRVFGDPAEDEHGLFST